MSTFSYTTFSGAKRNVTADRISFEPSGHVAFWAGDKLVRAVRTENCNLIQQEDD